MTAFFTVAIAVAFGGSEALSAFFRAIPADSGLGFVVIHLLGPDQEDDLAERLGRVANLPVLSARDGMPVAPNRIHLIRSEPAVGLRDGVLRFLPQAPQRVRDRPIDAFLRQLAADRRQQAVAVILSGAGTHGTGGLKEVRAAGGLVLVQDPRIARVSGMPGSAIATGLADDVLSPQEMPLRLLDYLAQVSPNSIQAENPAAPDRTLLARLTDLGEFDLHDFRPSVLTRLLHRRMALARTGSAEDYLAYLEAHPAEGRAFVHDLLFRPSRFLHDGPFWKALPELIPPPQTEEGAEPLRAWVPGCGTGEEAYSLVMALTGTGRAAASQARYRVFATDLVPEALAVARGGLYPDSIVLDLPDGYLGSFFESKHDHHYRIRKTCRERVTFGLQNPLQDPPYHRLDLICCRYLLPALLPDRQERLLDRFHFALRPGGLLVLGEGVAVEPDGRLFEPASDRWPIYRRLAEAIKGRPRPEAARSAGTARRQSPTQARTPDPATAGDKALPMDEMVQAINEELLASQEELQALNKELTVINTRLLDRNQTLQEYNRELTHKAHGAWEQARHLQHFLLELYRSQAHQRLLWTLDPSGTVMAPSPAWQAFTGQDFEQYQRGWLDAVHPADRAALDSHWQDCLSGGIPLDQTVRLYHAHSGQWQPCRLRAVPAYTETGTIRCWLGLGWVLDPAN